MSGRNRPHRTRSQPTPRPASGAQPGSAAATSPAPPPGPKTARPPKPGPASGKPGGAPPGPIRVRVVYRPVAATVLAAGTDRATDPEGAFDALYLHSAGALRRQVTVLTGDHKLGARAVRRAFGLAWQQWPEVARDSDPVGWLRAAAHTYAMAPWRRVPRRHRKTTARKAAARKAAVREAPAQDVPAQDAFAQALVRLHRERRRALLLHDGLGLSLAVTAAEVESSTSAAASRIIGARRELAAAAPNDYDGGDAGPLLAVLLAAEPDPPGGEPAPAAVRDAAERGARRRTVAAFAAAGAVVLATTVGAIVGPQHTAPPSHAPAHRQTADPSAGG